jgi:hypothetical protein
VPPAPAWLIENATVLTGTGDRLEGADVLMRNGVVEAVGIDLMPTNPERLFPEIANEDQVPGLIATEERGPGILGKANVMRRSRTEIDSCEEVGFWGVGAAEFFLDDGCQFLDADGPHHLGKALSLPGVVPSGADHREELEGKGEFLGGVEIFFEVFEEGGDDLGAGHRRFQFAAEDAVVNLGKDVADKVEDDLQLFAGSQSVVIDE